VDEPDNAILIQWAGILQGGYYRHC